MPHNFSDESGDFNGLHLVAESRTTNRYGTKEILNLLRKVTPPIPESKIKPAAIRISQDPDRDAIVAKLKHLALFVSVPCFRCRSSVTRLKRKVRGNIFCSRKCAAQKMTRMVSLVCFGCGIRFLKRAKTIKYKAKTRPGWNNFCSENCRIDSKRNSRVDQRQSQLP